MHKAIEYWHSYGIVALIKKVHIHFSFYVRREYKIKNGIYIVKNNYKTNIIKKTKKVNFYSIDLKKDYHKINELNNLGYDVTLITNDKIFEEILPVSEIIFKNEISKNDLTNSQNLIKNSIIIEKNSKNIDLSIVVLNYNNMDCIFKCIDSLIKYNSYNYEIIIVDNCSKDGSYQKILSKYEKMNNVKIIKNNHNGCASGRNIGVKSSNREYIMFLDSDQYVCNEIWLNNYIDIINSNNNVGAIGWTGGWFNREGSAKYTVDSFLFRNMPPYGLCRNDLGYLGSGGMLIKKSFFDKINGFDENYDPTCYEDTDISLKIRDNGLEILYCPYLSIIHKAHQTTKSGSDEHTKLIKEKGEYFKRKWLKRNKKLLKYKK